MKLIKFFTQNIKDFFFWQKYLKVENKDNISNSSYYIEIVEKDITKSYLSLTAKKNSIKHERNKKIF